VIVNEVVFSSDENEDLELFPDDNTDRDDVDEEGVDETGGKA